MTCDIPSPLFAISWQIGLKLVQPMRDGYSIYLSWEKAIPSDPAYIVGYNIYFSSNMEDVFSEGPKYFTTEDNLTISRFTTGDVYYFAEKAMEYDPLIIEYRILTQSPQAPNAYIYPESMLANNIDGYQLNIELVDATDFPPFGIIQVGAELIRYLNVDYGTNIITASVDGRGYYGTNIRYHNVDGYDGYYYQDPIVKLFRGFEDQNNVIIEGEPRFEPDEFPYIEGDGYRQVTKDVLNTDLSASDDYNEDIPSYDYSGYHQTNIIDYFSGHCIGSYSGGEYGCADGYKLRGLNIQEINMQRLETMLNVTSDRCVLLKRLWTGITCNCVRMNNETPEGRCPICLATGFVGGYEQFFNPRESDGKIMCRFGPTADKLNNKPIGFQQEFIPNCWTLVFPAIHERDILIRFNQDGIEEFRYEVNYVTRNKLLFSLSGSQQMQVYRLDKADITYQWRAIRDTSMLPSKINTTLSLLRGVGYHMHQIVINEDVLSLTDINNTTEVTSGHSHPIINGVVSTVLGHTHNILLI